MQVQACDVELVRPAFVADVLFSPTFLHRRYKRKRLSVFPVVFSASPFEILFATMETVPAPSISTWLSAMEITVAWSSFSTFHPNSRESSDSEERGRGLKETWM